MMARTRTTVFLGVIVVLIGASLATIAHVRKPKPTPALRGRQVAEALGCFACHGPGGTGGVSNPGSDEEQVPAWDGGTAMMYVENEQEIREWILYGIPDRLRESDEHSVSNGHEGHTHGDESESQLIHMPAFEGVLSTGELNDLVAYYKAVSAFESLPAATRAGYETASRLGCFGCHGPGGRLGSTNPGSFKGYIPPWHGPDYDELVRNDDELREWILDGAIERLESNPVARYFTRRQVIQMPAYRSTLREGDLEALIDYIHWLNSRLIETEHS